MKASPGGSAVKTGRLKSKSFPGKYARCLIAYLQLCTCNYFMTENQMIALIQSVNNCLQALVYISVCCICAAHCVCVSGNNAAVVY